jgi:hypothetical protein
MARNLEIVNTSARNGSWRLEKSGMTASLPLFTELPRRSLLGNWGIKRGPILYRGFRPFFILKDE